MQGVLHKHLDQLITNIKNDTNSISLPIVVNSKTKINNQNNIKVIDCSLIELSDLHLSNKTDTVIFAKINRINPAHWDYIISLVLSNNKSYFYTVDDVYFEKNVEFQYLSKLGRS